MEFANYESNPNQIGNSSGLSKHEQDFFADLLAKRRKYKDQSKINEVNIL